MVRKATNDDIEVLNNFFTKLSLSRLKYNNPSLNIVENNYLNELENENHIIFIDIENNKEVGYLHGYKENDKAILDQIFVLEDYREYGIGEKLVKEFKNWSLYNSLKNIEVTIENGNEAYFLFEKMGFDITSVLLNLNI